MADDAVQIRLHLYLRSSDLTPERISEELGMPFDRCHRIGEPRAKNHLNEQWWEANKKFWDEHWWIVDEEADSSYSNAYDDLSKTLDRLLTRVEQPWEGLARLASGGMGELAIVIKSDGYPGMGFNSDLLRRIARLNLSLDFDLYCEPECKRVHAD